MVDFEWYRSFIAIYKQESVSEAAKIRLMTQPAMSQHLASLEAEVGEKLFIRTSRKLVPTERGKQLYTHLAPHIESLEEKTLEIKQLLSPIMKTIKISTTEELFNEIILSHLPRMALSTITYFGDAEHSLEQLKENCVDIIVTTKRCLSSDIEYVRLMEEKYVIVVPYKTDVPHFKLLEDKEDWLYKQQWISSGIELPMIRRYWKEFFKKSPQINPVHVINNLELNLGAISEGAGIGLLPTHMLKQQEETNPKWKIIFEQMFIREEVFIGYRSRHKHLHVIHEIIDKFTKRKVE